MRTLCDTTTIQGGSDAGPRKVNLFQTPNMFLDVHVLRPGQAQKIHAHAAEDKAYLVLSGTPIISCGEEEQRATAGQLVFCPTGVPHGARNEGPDDARLLVVMAPHPRPEQIVADGSRA